LRGPMIMRFIGSIGLAAYLDPVIFMYKSTFATDFEEHIYTRLPPHL